MRRLPFFDSLSNGLRQFRFLGIGLRFFDCKRLTIPTSSSVAVLGNVSKAAEARSIVAPAVKKYGHTWKSSVD
jgi:hypothetical protein